MKSDERMDKLRKHLNERNKAVLESKMFFNSDLGRASKFLVYNDEPLFMPFTLAMVLSAFSGIADVKNGMGIGVIISGILLFITVKMNEKADPYRDPEERYKKDTLRLISSLKEGNPEHREFLSLFEKKYEEEAPKKWWNRLNSILYGYD